MSGGGAGDFFLLIRIDLLSEMYDRCSEGRYIELPHSLLSFPLDRKEFGRDGLHFW